MPAPIVITTAETRAKGEADGMYAKRIEPNKWLEVRYHEAEARFSYTYCDKTIQRNEAIELLASLYD